jgi:Ca2+-dependent lipid-binding protein
MWLPVQWPVASNRLIFKLYDYDSTDTDDLVGSMIFSIKSIVEAKD